MRVAPGKSLGGDVAPVSWRFSVRALFDGSEEQHPAGRQAGLSLCLELLAQLRGAVPDVGSVVICWERGGQARGDAAGGTGSLFRAAVGGMPKRQKWEAAKRMAMVVQSCCDCRWSDTVAW